MKHGDDERTILEVSLDLLEMFESFILVYIAFISVKQKCSSNHDVFSSGSELMTWNCEVKKGSPYINETLALWGYLQLCLQPRSSYLRISIVVFFCHFFGTA